MNSVTVKKSTLQGSVTIPPSKSQTLRAIIFAALSEGKSILTNCLPSPDTTAMINACQVLGAKIESFSDRLEVIGVNGHIPYAEDVIYAGNSGIVLRFCAAIGALSSRPIVITGDSSIRHLRPMKPLILGLRQMGVNVESMRGDDFAPVIIKGPLKGGRAVISGEDSQPVSALLIALAFANAPSEIVVNDPGEKPWVALTLSWFDRFQIPYQNCNYRTYRLVGGAQLSGFEYRVPGDLSSCAFPVAAALITRSELIVENVDMNDPQGDKALFHTFIQMGADLVFDAEKKRLHVLKSGKLKGLCVDVNEMIDAVPILAALACFAEGTTHITNGAIARHKESDRLHAMCTELTKMGANIEEKEAGLIIQGAPLHGALVESHLDHRVAMSLFVAGLGSSGETTIVGIECIVKSYPDFLDTFAKLNSSIEG